MTLERERIKQVLDLFVEVVCEHQASKDEFVYFTKLDWPLDYFFFFFLHCWEASRQLPWWVTDWSASQPRVVKKYVLPSAKEADIMSVCDLYHHSETFNIWSCRYLIHTGGPIRAWSGPASQGRLLLIRRFNLFYNYKTKKSYEKKCFHHLCTICVRTVMVLKKYTFSN